MKKILCNIILLAGTIFITGCNNFISLVGKGENKIPINVKNQNILPIYIYDVNSSLIPGSIIGGHYDGLSRVKQQHYFASATISEYWQKQYIAILSEECILTGYYVADQDESAISFFNPGYIVLSGSILNMDIKTYGELGGDCTEVSLEILWQFYHSIDNRLIYQSKVRGDAYQGGMAIEITSLDAYQKSVKNLLADSTMVNEIISYSNENSWYYQFSVNDDL
jgi:serine protease Do